MSRYVAFGCVGCAVFGCVQFRRVPVWSRLRSVRSVSLGCVVFSYVAFRLFRCVAFRRVASAELGSVESS